MKCTCWTFFFLFLVRLSMAQENPGTSFTVEAIENQVKTLIEMLGDENAARRNWAVGRLSGIGNSVIPTLTRDFSARPYGVRREIVTILGRIATPEAKGKLIEMILDPDYGVRNRVSIVLIDWADKDPQLIDQIKMVQYRNPHVQSSLQILVETIVYKKVEQELSLLISPQGGFGFYEGQFKSLLPLGKEAIQPLLDIFIQEKYQFVNTALQHDEEVVYKMKYLAGEAIGEFNEHLGEKKESVVSALRNMLFTSKEDQLKEIAMTSLYFIGDKVHLDQRIRYWQERIQRDPFNEENYSQLGLIFLRIRREKEGIQTLKKAIQINPNYALAYYNLACGYACIGQIDQALDAIENAVEKGYDDVGWMKKDGDLRNIHSTQRFKNLVKKLEDRLGGK